MQLSREIYSGEAIHITSTFWAVLGAIGSVCSIVSLVLYLYDKQHDKKKGLLNNPKRKSQTLSRNGKGLLFLTHQGCG